jgi:DNA-directed RNA polymerase subunit RPC12/RpoP
MDGAEGEIMKCRSFGGRKEGSNMIWYKTCTRCGGDVTHESDIHGEFISCMQCGSILNDQQERALLGSTKEPSHYGLVLAGLTVRQKQLPVSGQGKRAA